MLSKSSLSCLVFCLLLAVSSAQDCTSLHPRVGSSGELSTLEHDVAGTVTVLDDCSFSVVLTYDGTGPDVFWYGADSEANLGTGVIMDPIEGEHDAKTVIVSLPLGITWDDISVLSVWCRDFGVNFGSVVLPLPEIILEQDLDTEVDSMAAPGME